MIPVALTGRFYRNIGDIDCFIEDRFKKAINGELEERGYTRSGKRDEDVPLLLSFLGFRTEVFVQNNKKISLLFVSFKDRYMEIPLRLGLSFKIPFDLMNKSYNLYGKEFRGSIPEAALFSLSLTRDKTKRDIDLSILLPLCSLETIGKIKHNDTFFWFSKKVPMISSFLSSKINRFISE